VAVSGGLPAGRFGGRTVGYAVTGLTRDIGYLQRLAVDPDTEGRGIGRILVLDGLRWARDNGAEQAVVNTQVGNARALALYESLGFRRLPEGLSVLGRTLDPPGGDTSDGPAAGAPGARAPDAGRSSRDSRSG
jgi:ribosomal protein S18 acetylase RimI-like enzyme